MPQTFIVNLAIMTGKMVIMTAPEENLYSNERSFTHSCRLDLRRTAGVKLTVSPTRVSNGFPPTRQASVYMSLVEKSTIINDFITFFFIVIAYIINLFLTLKSKLDQYLQLNL